MAGKNHIPFLILILVMAYFSVVHGFWEQTLNMWDEATYANNAIDMMQEPSIIVKHLGEVDLYNTKPPLVIAMQAVGMKYFGIGTFAVRLPSILFSLFTVILLYIYSVRWFKKPWIGMGAAVIILCSTGYVRNHVALTGDLDAVLCFFLTAGFLQGVHIVVNKKMGTGGMLLFGVFVVLGFYSKGVAGFFHLPALFVLALLFHRKVFSGGKMYVIAAFILLLCAGYYYLREQAAPGYLEIVLSSELSRVSTVVMDWQVRPMAFYFTNFVNGYFFPWIYLFPLGLSLFYMPKQYGKVGLALLIGIVFYFLLISYPQVKLDWYDAPLYPLMALFIAISTYHVLCIVIKKEVLRNRVFMLLLVAIATPNLIEIVKTRLNPDAQVEALEYEGYFLDKLGKMDVSNKKITIYRKEQEKEHNDQMVFYERARSEYEITYKTMPDFKALEIVLVSQEELKQKMDSLYKYQILLQDSVTGSQLRMVKQGK